MVILSEDFVQILEGDQACGDFVVELFLGLDVVLLKELVKDISMHLDTEFSQFIVKYFASFAYAVVDLFLKVLIDVILCLGCL